MNNKATLYFFISLLFCGCVPVIERGEYISLEKTPEIKVLEMGIPEKRNFSPIRPISHKGEKLKLKLINRTKLQNEQACIFVIDDIGNAEIQYLRLQLWNSGCEKYYDNINEFDVAVINGDHVLATQKILFELKEGGYYVRYDSI